jgi:hypothetical protein
MQIIRHYAQVVVPRLQDGLDENLHLRFHLHRLQLEVGVEAGVEVGVGVVVGVVGHLVLLFSRLLQVEVGVVALKHLSRMRAAVRYADCKQKDVVVQFQVMVP